MITTRIFIFIALFFVQSCAVLPHQPKPYAYISGATKFNLLSTQSLKRYTTVNQLVKGKYGEKTYDFNLVTKFAPDDVTTVALTKFGARIFTVKYSNDKVDFQPSPVVPSGINVRPEYVLADMQLVYWPVEAIQKNLEGGLKITEAGQKRILTRNGKTVSEITYSKADIWQSVVHYKNFERNYEYSIENL